MAEGRPASEVLCRYFMHGACREGSQCHFSHDRDRAKPAMICRYYLRGCCAFGDRCRFDHVKPTANNKQASAGNNFVLGNNLSPGTSTSGPKPIPVSNEIHRPLAKSFSGKSPKLGREGCMTVLRKKGGSEEATSKNSFHVSNWADAPEFIPTSAHSPLAPKSYADAVLPEVDKFNVTDHVNGMENQLCPYGLVSSDQCPFGDKCQYIHGNVCDLCGYSCLHPYDEEQRKVHTQECMKEHERDMELSFAVARSQDKTCGICMDLIMEKFPPSERRFGILPNCCHVYCLSCIRKWRNAKQFENKNIRSCPECRVTSDFIAPSKYWVENKEEKEKLIASYRKALSLKPCKYFKQGKGECPFGGNCFYLHAYPDGSKAELPPPQPRKRHNADGEVDFMESVFLWDIFEERYSHWLLQLQLDDSFDLLTDSDDDSDWSDFD